MKLKLINKKNEIGDVITFVLKPEMDLSWLPGQFFHYVLEHPDIDNRGLERWFTISSAPYEKNIMITTRILAKDPSSFKSYLNLLPLGSEIEADGPKGKFILDATGEFTVFIAGGIGITPFRSILLDAVENKNKLDGVLLYANRENLFYFKEELTSAIAKLRNFNIEYFAKKDIEADNILASIPSGLKPTFYVSGPEPMVEAYVKLLLSMGFSDDQIKKDFFPGYDWH
jgi:ferredoxin-NADP reductase